MKWRENRTGLQSIALEIEQINYYPNKRKDGGGQYHPVHEPKAAGGNAHIF